MSGKLKYSIVDWSLPRTCLLRYAWREIKKRSLGRGRRWCWFLRLSIPTPAKHLYLIGTRSFWCLGQPRDLFFFFFFDPVAHPWSIYRAVGSTRQWDNWDHTPHTCRRSSAFWTLLYFIIRVVTGSMYVHGVDLESSITYLICCTSDLSIKLLL